MNCKYYTKICARCKKSDDYIVFDRNCTTDYNLENYENYVNFDLQQCPFCGYISDDVEKGYTMQTEETIKSKEYEYLYKYSYLQPSQKAINKNFLVSYPANLYECYSLVLFNNKDYKNATRALFKTVLLKETLVNRFTHQMEEDIEDLTNEEIAQFKSLIKSLNDSIYKNIETILNMSKNFENDIFTNLIYVECLIKLNKMQHANQLLTKLKSKLNCDLLAYLQNKIN